MYNRTSSIRTPKRQGEIILSRQISEILGHLTFVLTKDVPVVKRHLQRDGFEIINNKIEFFFST